MITLLCALSSNRAFTGFSTHEQEKILAIFVISLLVQVFSLMYSCFVLVLSSTRHIIVTFSVTISSCSWNYRRDGEWYVLRNALDV